MTGIVSIDAGFWHQDRVPQPVYISKVYAPTDNKAFPAERPETKVTNGFGAATAIIVTTASYVTRQN